MTTGIIYHIINHANNWIYVGSTLNEKERLRRHMRHLEKGKHVNKTMQEDYQQHGSQNFSISIVERDVPEDVLHLHEEAQIALLFESNDGRVYNKSRARRISPTSRQNIAAQRFAHLKLLYDRESTWSAQRYSQAKAKNGKRRQNSSSDCTPTITLPSMLVLPL